MIVFWVSLGAALVLRSYSSGMMSAERYADLAVFQAGLNDAKFPPIDRWLSGVPLNYYYFGQLLFVPITKATAVPAEFAFNLATATIAAMAASCSYAAVRMLGGRKMWAFFSSGAAILFGNAYWIYELMHKGFSAGLFWWDSSRAVRIVYDGPETITEFPYFSFLLGDFHAHYIALPWLTLTLGVLFAFKKALGLKNRSRAVVLTVLAALSVGLHYPLNPWALPFVALLTVLVLFRRWFWIAAVGGGALILYLPFWITYARPIASFGWVPIGLRSPLFLFVLHWGLFLVPLWGLIARDVREISKNQWFVASLTALISGAIAGPAAGLIVLTFVLLRFERHIAISSFAGALLTVSFLAIVLSEVIHVDNLYGPALVRMNTVFKFWIFAWWGLAIAVALLLGSRLPKWFYGIICGVVAVGLVYPLFATGSRLERGKWNPTLNGMADWERSAPGEREAVEWLGTNAGLKDVIFEATGLPYNRFGRFSAFSGRPTVLGWSNHEWIWRKDGHALTEERQRDIDHLSSDPTTENLKQFVGKYSVRWFVVGDLERKAYSTPLLERLKTFPVAFENSRVTIYRAL